jgi:methylene-fatty-acyl-phospholipid synthase
VASVNATTFGAAAVALALERVTYAVVYRRPDLFARTSRGIAPRRDPVDVLAALFVAFKGIQAAVFVWWCAVHGDGLTRASADPVPFIAGVVLIVVGQVLNVGVFARLGRTGVFYGNRLGHHVAWCQGFPFSVVRHPQYVGTALSIWGFFLAMRYPAPDWMALPLISTVYYVVSSHVEQLPDDAGLTELPPGRARAADPRASAHPE